MKILVCNCLCTFLCVYIRVYKCMGACIHMHIYTYTHTYLYTYIHIYIHISKGLSLVSTRLSNLYTCFGPYIIIIPTWSFNFFDHVVTPSHQNN